MAISSHHTDKRIYVLLLLIVAMLVGMYVISFKKVTTSSQAASSADQTCIERSGDPNAYCKNKFDLCKTSPTRFIGTSYTCDGVLKNCCILETGTGLRGSNLDAVCRRNSGNPAAYCNRFGVACGPGFTKQGSCGGLVPVCCVPDTAAATPIPVPRAQGTTDSDCGTAHADCRRTAAAPKCRNISLIGTAIYRCVPEGFRASPTVVPRPTAGTIAPNNVCPPPIVTGGVKTCQTQGYRWGPAQNGAKTCYSICGNLYSTYCGNAKLLENNVTPCCTEALSKPVLFSKVCCDKLNPNDIKSALGESEAKKNCPNVVF